MQIILSRVIAYKQIVLVIYHTPGFPRWLSGKDSTHSTGATGGVGSIPGSGRSLEKKMATSSNIIARKIPWTEEPGEL